MKIAMITDQHFGVRNDQPLFMENQLKFYKETFFPHLDKQKIKTVFMLGDTWDRRKYVNLNTLHMFKKHYFDELAKRDIKVIMIYGNHDVYHRNTNEVNSVDFLEGEYKNIHVVKSHEVINVGGVDFGFISWVNNENLEDSMKFIKTAPCRILCGHFEIKSFEMVKGSVCEHGFDKTLFDRYDEVWSGHFHVIGTDGKIQYLSNTNQTNWSDYGLKKGFWEFDTKTMSKKHIENPFSLYEKIAFSDDFDIISFDYAAYSDKIVRVYVKNFEVANRKKLDLYMDKLNAFAFNVELMESSLSIDEDEEMIDMESSDTMVMVGQYIDSIIAGTTLDKEKLLRYFGEIYTSAQERLVSA
jgi:DNA repair exonuclease SbcCD nuclease subunit